MSPLNASAPDAVSIEGRESDRAGRLIGRTNNNATVKLADPRQCLMACSLPPGSCSYRCIFVEVPR
jgi:hypothetical protein